jgi:hypothetical protein
LWSNTEAEVVGTEARVVVVALLAGGVVETAGTGLVAAAAALLPLTTLGWKFSLCRDGVDNVEQEEEDEESMEVLTTAEPRGGVECGCGCCCGC